MDFGNSPTTTLTERIMAAIRPHLKVEPPPQESHHYNRVYEAVHRVLSEAAPRSKGEKPTLLYYFGCWDRPGHYLHEPSGRTVGTAGPFTSTNLDGTFPNHIHIQGSSYNRRVEDEIIASLAHWKGWTVLAMWDRSVDTRGACNAAFVAKGEFSTAEMWVLAHQQYPQIVARLKAAPPRKAGA